MRDRELDWLEEMAKRPGGILLHNGGTETGRLGLGLLGRTLREAIDQAMEHEPGKDRTCYHCEHFFICRVVFAFQEVINKAGAFFDCDLPMVDPRHWQNILVAVANSCKRFKFKPEE